MAVNEPINADVPVLEEQVPIDLGQLAAAKKALTDADTVAQESSSLGITLAKMIAATAQKGQEAQEAELSVQTALRQIIVSLAIKPDEFRGFDFDKGVVKIQRAPTTVEDAAKEAGVDTSSSGTGAN